MKKTFKIFYILFISIGLIFSLQNITLAAPNSEITTLQGENAGSGSSSNAKPVSSNWASSYLEDAEGWGNKADASSITDPTEKIVGTVILVIRTVGIGISIIMITYVAIKYMSAAPNEKAEFKKSATSLIVGAIVLFASSNILTLIADFATKNI